ncbi:precorrin-3B C(17)-methyltransferase [Hoeflea sp. WL0058]|uniref:Precorrin-3B C(17)-methyltransferase n=1 Tax=Flavimaribacter sediminis TaxID=2865987 RepID=A0AAE2ZGX9_9HYPH|nr:precorrin-3B C(17)-methyltransferase [Flavimaribacter sediminis]MBW8635996.1 precorrin-3B C(17)-methyltransferase [Flavimaribacter sediminis]
MRIEVSPAVIVLNKTSVLSARKLAEELGGELHGPANRVAEADMRFDEAAKHVRDLFEAGRPIVAFMASGALIRILAPVLSDKLSEPPVVSLSEGGRSVVPLLGGHHGANDLAKRAAAILDGHAAVTTAGDLRFGVALDAPPEGYRLVNPQEARGVMAELVAGQSARLTGEAEWLAQSKIPFQDDAAVRLTVSDTIIEPESLELVYAPATLCIGVGCERGAETAEVIALIERQLADSNLSPDAVSGLYSMDLKADEVAIHAAARHFNAPARFFTATELEAEAGRLENPSETVFREVGCHGVAEGAALAAAGYEAELIAPKVKSQRATCAIARSPQPVLPAMRGWARGQLFVVGIGPGSAEWRSPEVSGMVGQSTDLVGYSLYLDLLGRLAEGKQRHDFDLGKEEARVRHAMELAGAGNTVSLVCSGDAGIYAMATLVFELLDTGEGLSDAARRIAVEVSPGISALQAAAARIGAPLGHDFCTISLSDLLTPWESIKRRVKAAGEADFVIAFYNPVSRRRRTQLAWARDELLKVRPADTPVVLATNLGRSGETVRVAPLAKLDVDDVDMLTVVIVGSSMSRTVKTGDGRSWVYTPRGYAAKPDSTLKPKAALS